MSVITTTASFNEDNAWLNEVELDDQGRAVFGYRPSARLTGADESTIRYHALKVRDRTPVKWLQPLSDIELEVAGCGKLLDLTVHKFLLHYAEEGYAQAHQTLLAMSAVGLRAYVRDAKGWGKQVPMVMPTHIEALRGWADTLVKLNEAQAEIAVMKPSVTLAQNYLESDTNIKLTQVAKMLGTNAKRLGALLRAEGVLMQSTQHITPKAGYETWFNVIQTEYNGAYRQDTFVTTLGQAEIVKLLRN